MKNGKYSARRSGSKVLVLALAMVLLVTATVGGTLAWLTDKTDEVKNTFTTAGIKIELTETWNYDSNNDGTKDSWQAALVPGYEYKKDPKVSVDATVTTEDIYLFVKFEEKNISPENDSEFKYLEYTSTLSAENSDWTKGLGESVTEGEGAGVPTNVWYRIVKATDATKSWNLLAGKTNDENLKDGYVKVNDKLTKEKMPKATGDGVNPTPELTYTAYACQLWKTNKPANLEDTNAVSAAQFTPKEAWDNVKNLGSSTTNS